MTVWLQFMVQRIRNWMLQYCHCNFPIFVVVVCVVVAIARLFEVDSKPHTKLNFYVLQAGFGLQWVHGEVISWQWGKTTSFAVFCYDWRTKAGWLPASCHIKWNVIRVCVCKCVCVCVRMCLSARLSPLTDWHCRQTPTFRHETDDKLNIAKHWGACVRQ